MRAKCCICSDVLDEVQTICATLCGHVYHSSCLMLWAGQCKTCPICRSEINLMSVLKLYFDFPTTPPDSSSNLENEVSNLKASISAKDIELQACRKERDVTKALVREAEKKASDLEQSLYRGMSEISDLRSQVKSTATLQSLILKLREDNDSLAHELQILKNIQSILYGSEKDADAILLDCVNGPISLNEMASYCAIFKRENKKLIIANKKLSEQNSKLRKAKCRFADKVKFYKAAMASLSSEKSTKFQKQKGFARSAKLNNSPASNAKASKSGNKTSNKNNPDISPSSVPLNKSKSTMRIVASSSRHKIETTTEVEEYTSVSSVTIKRRSDDGSIKRTGYNGQSNFPSSSSGIKKRRISKK